MDIVACTTRALGRLAGMFLPNPAYWVVKIVWRLRRIPRFRQAAGFREKIMYKLAFDRRRILADWTDKLRAREYARSAAPEVDLPELYWQSDDPRSLPLDALPDEFILKASHGSGWSRFVFDKSSVDGEALIEVARDWVRRSYFRETREWAYRDIVPRVYAEQILRNADGTVAGDWNLYVFHGKVRLLQALTDLPDGTTIGASYGRNRRRLDVEIAYAQAPDVEMSAHVEKMIRIAEALSHGIDFVRVDLYLVGDRVYFGEMTSYPNAGALRIVPESFDEILGRWLRLDWDDYALQEGFPGRPALDRADR